MKLLLLLLWTTFPSSALVHTFPATILFSTSVSSDIIQAAPNNPRRLLLLDRDGVVNEDVGSPGVTNVDQLQLTPQAGVAIGNLRRNNFSVALITNQSCVGKGLITREYLDQTITGRLQEMLLAQDPDAILDGIFVCTTRNDISDARRKPGPGMILEAMHQFLPTREAQKSPYNRDLGSPKKATTGISTVSSKTLRESSVIFVGDTVTDMQAAYRAGVDCRILVSTGYGAGLMGREQQHPEHQPPRIIQDTPTTSQELPETLRAVMPFVNVRDLKAAADWILEDCDNS